jgi:hypothetical protein
MAIGNLQVGSSTNRTTSGNVKSGQGALLGFYVNSTSSGVVQFYDDPSTGTTTAITGAITPAIGWQPLPVCFATGLNFVLNSGTINVTLVWV